MATTALVFDAVSWPTYAAANILIALTYGLIGALLAPIFGRVGGVFIAFLLPFLDIGIVQSPMLAPEPTTLSKLLPGYGGTRVLIDGALTQSFDELVPLLTGLGWLAALTVAVALTYRRATRPARAPQPAATAAPAGQPHVGKHERPAEHVPAVPMPSRGPLASRQEPRVLTPVGERRITEEPR